MTNKCLLISNPFVASLQLSSFAYYSVWTPCVLNINVTTVLRHFYSLHTQGRRQGGGFWGPCPPPPPPNPPTAKILREYTENVQKTRNFVQFLSIFGQFLSFFPQNFPQGVIIVPKMPE